MTKKMFFITTLVILVLAIFSNMVVAQSNWIIPTDDCYSYKDLTDAAPETQNYNEWLIRIRSDDDRYLRDGYLKFSLENTDFMFPEDVKLAFLQLTLARWYNQSSGSGYYGTFSIYGAEDNTWTEDALTWTNAPWSKENTGLVYATLKDTIDQIGSTNPARKIYFNVTDYVKEQLNNGNSVFSMVLSDTTYGTLEANGTDARIYSKDCIGDPGAERDPDSTFLPYLVINENPMWVDYVRVPVSEDCYIEKRADTGDGATENFNTWRVWVRSDDDKHARIAYLKFSFDNTPYAFPEDIDSVFLNITIDRLYNYSGKYSQFAVYDIGDNSWSEETLTWDTAPWVKENAGDPIGTWAEQLEEISGTDPIYPVWFDITAYVRDQLNQGNTTFSLALCDETYWDTEANLSDIRFFSKDCLDPTIGADAEKDPEESYIPCLYVQSPLNETAIKDDVAANPATFAVYQNYPNPFNPETKISFSLSKTSDVKVTVVDLLGRQVRALLNETRNAGAHQIHWNGLNEAGAEVASGIYFTKVTAEGQSKMVKMLLVR